MGGAYLLARLGGQREARSRLLIRIDFLEPRKDMRDTSPFLHE